MFFDDLNILKQYQQRINFEEIKYLHLERLAQFSEERWQELRETFAAVKGVSQKYQSSGQELLHHSAIKVGNREELSKVDFQILIRALEALIPWRKGPFCFFGEEVDSEWRSDFKWARLLAGLDSVQGKIVADVGCGNAYHMFRTLEQKPELVVGFDPTLKFYLQYQLAQMFLTQQELSFLLLGIEHLPLLGSFFDTVICMGVIYHHRNPKKQLEQLKSGLKPGGQLLLESITIPGPDDYFLQPEGRYAKMRNVHFVPSIGYLCSLLEETGFVEINPFSEVKLETVEQRSTKYAPFDSLVDFLSVDEKETIEGHPAPYRAIISAQKSY